MPPACASPTKASNLPTTRSHDRSLWHLWQQAASCRTQYKRSSVNRIHLAPLVKFGWIYKAVAGDLPRPLGRVLNNICPYSSRRQCHRRTLQKMPPRRHGPTRGQRRKLGPLGPSPHRRACSEQPTMAARSFQTTEPSLVRPTIQTRREDLWSVALPSLALRSKAPKRASLARRWPIHGCPHPLRSCAFLPRTNTFVHLSAGSASRGVTLSGAAMRRMSAARASKYPLLLVEGALVRASMPRAR